jgi:hypothetical protein
LKSEYKRFCEAWNNEKLYQRILIADGAKTDVVGKREDGTAIEVIKQGDQQLAVLGKKPTFSMWLQAKKNKAFQSAQEVVDKKVEVVDKEW